MRTIVFTNLIARIAVFTIHNTGVVDILSERRVKAC